MPSKYYLRNFTPGYYYHIYNRGAHKADIFKDKNDYETFLEIMEYYLKFPKGKPLSYKEKLINTDTFQVRNLENKIKPSFFITCFILMPNHFHFLIKQVSSPSDENSIINFMRRISITYSLYFKKKYEHSGYLFQGRYKNILVSNEDYLLQLTKYIHSNYSELIKDKQKLSEYPYSSYPNYLGNKIYPWIKNGEIIDFFSKTNPVLSYRSFVEKTPVNINKIKKLIIE